MAKKSEIKIGFTGSRDGFNERQSKWFEFIIDHWVKNKYLISEFHHGDCIGADQEAHDKIIQHNIGVVIHPPTISNQRAYCKDSIRIEEEKPYLTRNKDIVDDVDIMIAISGTDEEHLRSGTWSTIRYAKKQNKPLIILYPCKDIEIMKEYND